MSVDSGTPGVAPFRRRGTSIALMLGCAVVAVVLAGVGIGDEAYVSLQGDMARHMMNGTFLMDAVFDWPKSAEAFEYARHYYARYPALSLGHHPILLAIAEAPVFAVFGPSVASARMVSLTFFVVGVVFLYKLVSEVLGEWPGAAAALAYASGPQTVRLAQSVMTETPALSLLLGASYFAHRFAVTGQSRAIYVATILAAGSLWAKQLAAAALPGVIVYVWFHLGWRRLMRRDVVCATLVSAALVAPLVPMTMLMSPYNVAHAVSAASSVGESGRVADVADSLSSAALEHFSLPILMLSVVGFVLLVIRRSPFAPSTAIWIAGTGLVVGVAANQDPVRYAIYWTPAVAICFGALATLGGGLRSWILGAVMMAALVAQVVESSRIRLAGADGYEQAARFVVDHPRGSTVMFAGDVDAGFFSFFVRKHDPERKAIVLRADKLLTTSMMGAVAIEDRIADASQIAGVVRTFGVGYVVVEDRPSRSKVQNWLLDELKTAGYVVRLTLPTFSTDVRLRNVNLLVYEVLNATPAAPDARLDIRLPLVSQQIDVPVSDLINRKYLR